MAYIVNFVVPRMGEPIEGARLVNWNVQPGQSFRAGDILFEIETDKSIVEVPAAQDGKLLEQNVAVDGLIDADTVVARLEAEGQAPAGNDAEPAGGAPDAPAAASSAAKPARPDAPPAAAASPPATAVPAARGARMPATPAARRIAREQGLDLAAVAGRGPAGRITQADIRAALGAPAAPSSRAGQAGVREQDIPTRHGSLHAVRWTAAAPSGAPELVLLHGLFGDTDLWAATGSAMQRAGLNATAIDLPCHGRSGSNAAKVDDIVQAVAEAVAALGRGPVALAGHSFGAAIAAKVARTPGLNIAYLTLLSPAGLGTEIAQNFVNGMLYADSDEALTREVGKLTANGTTPSQAYLRELRSRIAARRETLAAFCRSAAWNGVQQVDIVADLAALDCPATLVHGRRDAVIPWRHALNAPPQVALHLVAQSGHMPQWEASALVASLLARRG